MPIPWRTTTSLRLWRISPTLANHPQSSLRSGGQVRHSHRCPRLAAVGLSLTHGHPHRRGRSAADGSTPPDAGGNVDVWRHARRAETLGHALAALQHPVRPVVHTATLALAAGLSLLFGGPPRGIAGAKAPSPWVSSSHWRSVPATQTFLSMLSIMPSPDIELKFNPRTRRRGADAQRYATYSAATTLGHFWVLHDAHGRALSEEGRLHCPSWRWTWSTTSALAA